MMRPVFSVVLLSATTMAQAQSCQPYFSGGQTYGYSATVFDDGTGPALYAAGYFAGGSRTVGRWRGDGWDVLSTGLPTPSINRETYWVLVLDDGNGPQLYSGGTLSGTGQGVVQRWMRRWSGLTWTEVPGLGSNDAWPDASWNDGNGSRIYGFVKTGTLPDRFAPARWNGTSWDTIGGTFVGPTSMRMAVLRDDTGDRLYMVSTHYMFDGIPGPRVTRWTGSGWEPIGPVLPGLQNRAIVSVDHGQGPRLYLGDLSYMGAYPNGVYTGRIVYFDGENWVPIPGGGIANIGINAMHKLAVFDDGRGPALYIAGIFTQAGGIAARNVVRFDGQNYEPLGAGMGWSVEDTAVFNDGRGDALFFIGNMGYVGGGVGSSGFWVGCPNCYPNCDLSTAAPMLNVADFGCFLRKYAAQDPYANCNVDAAIDIADFACFLQKFAAGCH